MTDCWCGRMRGDYVVPTEVIAFSNRAKEFEAANTQLIAASTNTKEHCLAWVMYVLLCSILRYVCIIVHHHQIRMVVLHASLDTYYCAAPFSASWSMMSRAHQATVITLLSLPDAYISFVYSLLTPPGCACQATGWQMVGKGSQLLQCAAGWCQQETVTIA